MSMRTSYESLISDENSKQINADIEAELDKKRKQQAAFAARLFPDPPSTQEQILSELRDVNDRLRRG